MCPGLSRRRIVMGGAKKKISVIETGTSVKYETD